MGRFDDFGETMKKAALDFKQGAMDLGNEVAEGIGNVRDTSKRSKCFETIGADLFSSGAVTSHGGNLSMTDGMKIWISRTNSMLGHLASDDIVETDWEIGPLDEGASRELIVHRAMFHGYQQRDGLEPGGFTAAIVHAHTRHTIAASLFRDEIVPDDSEGIYTLGDKPVPVVQPADAIGSEEASLMLGQAVFDGASIAIIKGHGPFAIAPTLEEAYRLVSVLEASCEILDIRDSVYRAR